MEGSLKARVPLDAIGTARAGTGCCISNAASATPSGQAAIPNRAHTKK
jgi:hypothetical protein